MLNEEITLLARQETPDGGGGATIAWVEGTTVLARVESLSSRRERLATRDIGIYRQRVTLRERGDIDHDTRLTHDGLLYRITSIRQLRDGYLTLDIEEVR